MKVAIIGGNGLYQIMFEEFGFSITNEILDADLVQFTGGEDVTPLLYNEQAHPTTYYSPARDNYEKTIFELAVEHNKPCAGICRGGQFLNVLNGGSLWQDVDNHAIHGTHDITDLRSGRVIPVSSTHHQMMRPTKKGLILATANESTRLHFVNKKGRPKSIPQKNEDVEVVYYPETNSLCFQPHPEFNNITECRQYYKELIEEFLLN